VCVHRQESNLLGQHNPYAIRNRGYQVRLSVRVWAEFVKVIDVGPSLLSDRFTTKKIHDFFGLLEEVLLVL
jgi:hypothetical protein